MVAWDTKLVTNFLNRPFFGLTRNLNVGFVAHINIPIPWGPPDPLIGKLLCMRGDTARNCDTNHAGIVDCRLNRFGLETEFT